MHLVVNRMMVFQNMAETTIEIIQDLLVVAKVQITKVVEMSEKSTTTLTMALFNPKVVISCPSLPISVNLEDKFVHNNIKNKT
jgi:hypothetical protein